MILHDTPYGLLVDWRGGSFVIYGCLVPALCLAVSFRGFWLVCTRYHAHCVYFGVIPVHSSDGQRSADRDERCRSGRCQPHQALYP